MKKSNQFLLWAICGAFFMLFFVMGCSQPVIETPAATADTTTATTATTPDTTTTKPYYVKNSLWKDVDISTVSTSRAVSDISFDQALSIVTEYNTENNDDQLRLDTTDIPITEAPTVDVYIAQPVDGHYVIIAQELGMDRAYFAEHKQLYEQDAITQKGVLFVDKVPDTVPVVVPVIDNRTRHEKYHIQMVNKYNKIVVYQGYRCEESCEETWDLMHGIVSTFDFASLDVYFASTLSMYEVELRSVGLVPEDTPWRVISGQVFVESTE